MNSRLKLAHKGSIFIALPLLVVLGLFAYLINLVAQAEVDVKKQIQSKNIVAQANLVSKHYAQLTASAAGYSSTRNPIYKERCVRFASEICASVRKLRALIAGSGSSATAVDALDMRTGRASAILNSQDLQSSALSRDAENLVWTQAYRELLTIADAAQAQAEKIAELERQVDDTMSKARQRSHDELKAALMIAVAFSVVFAGVLAKFFSKEITGRLRVISENSRRLAMGNELCPALSGGDEIAEVDRAFHRMANALNEASKRERSLIENAVDVICSIQNNGAFSEVSPAAIEVFGYAPEELLGQRFVNLVVEEQREKMVANIHLAVERKSTFTFENQIVKKDGSIRDILWSGNFSEENQSFFCVAHDVTERKNVERLKQEFVNMISHDLRTPLTSLQITLTLLREGAYGKLPKASVPKLEMAAVSVTRLINLINELLDVEKQEAGKLSMNFEETSILKVMENSLNAVRTLGESKGVSVQLFCEDFSAIVDADRLTQVIINLLGNSVKFSPAGGIIKCASWMESQQLNIEVCDQGKGIPADYKDRIFDRFEQVKLKDARFKGGTGLGLAICKLIVLEHGGTIGVESEEGKGSTFWVKIPIIQKEQ